MPTGTSTTLEPAKELDEAEERDEERDDIDRPARRGQLEREGDEDLAEPQRRAPPPRQRGELFFVEPAGEKSYASRVSCVKRRSRSSRERSRV